MTTMADITTATALDEVITCTVTGLTTPGTFVWKQALTDINSDDTNFDVNSDSTLTNFEQKSVLTIKPGGFIILTSTTTTFTCEFTSGEDSTSPKGEETFSLTKLAYGKY